jgi:uncharacterized membrane protein YdjX (TVP38/TMEM64 family)
MPTQQFSLRTIVLGILSFALVIGAMLALIEWIGVERIQDMIDTAGPLAPLVYVFIKAVTMVFAPLTAGPIQLSAGVLFGLWEGAFYSLLGEVIGGTIAFWIARRLGRAAVRRFVGAEGMDRVDELGKQVGGWRALVFARLFLFSIYDFITYAAGLANVVTMRQYVLITTLFGIVPTLLFVGIGASLAEDRAMVMLFYAAIGVLAAIPFALHWFQLRRERQRMLRQ